MKSYAFEKAISSGGQSKHRRLHEASSEGMPEQLAQLAIYLLFLHESTQEMHCK
jgi:hypothetical protein